ncbi:MAG: hypothetical protein HBSAPP03_27190 [Phycisphaerae bacterium]|nr:MAG: hypothetical protein HBSAPP03_27190 [Phycisphaerae bacterium]
MTTMFVLALAPPDAVRLILAPPEPSVWTWGRWVFAAILAGMVLAPLVVHAWRRFVDRHATALAFATVAFGPGTSRRERVALRALARARGMSPLALWLSDHARAQAERAIAENRPPTRPKPPRTTARKR